MKQPKLKDGSLIKADKANSTGGIDWVIAHGKKIGEVFAELPQGIIDKTQTGIGGTSCELDASRNSIIVQPYIPTAQAKANIPTWEKGYTVYFYEKGTKTVQQPKGPSGKLSTKPILESDLRLRVYIKACSDQKNPIKITCVTDQLPHLKDALNRVKPNSFLGFHLVLDEIDSLQEQSNFRPAMEPCFQIYKEHPEDQRTMITATLKKLHDPDLSSEPISTIKEHGARKKTLALVVTGDTIEEIIKQIEVRLTTNPNDKIFVACNHIGRAVEAIGSLEQLQVIKGRSMKLLCSKDRKSEAGIFYGELLPGGILPATINFVTAAYFTGFDLNEDCHCYILAENMTPSLRLSPTVIYQISGRCRKKLLSASLILRHTPGQKVPEYGYQELLKHAEEVKEGRAFIEKLRSSQNPVTRASAGAIENIYLEGTDVYPSVTYKERDGALVVSYLKIDNWIEQLATMKAYLTVDFLRKKLQDRFKVTDAGKLHLTGAEKQKLKIDVGQRGDDLIGKLKAIDRGVDYNQAIKQVRKEIPSPVQPFEQLLCDTYLQGCSTPAVDLRKLVIAMDKVVKTGTYAHGLKLLLVHLQHISYSEAQSTIQGELELQFRKGEEFTVSQLEQRCRKYANLLTDLAKTLDPKTKSAIKVLKTRPLMVRDSLLTFKKRHTKLGVKYVIDGYKPYDVIS